MFLVLKVMIVTLGVLGVTTSFASDEENIGKKIGRKPPVQQVVKKKEPFVKGKGIVQKTTPQKAKTSLQQGGRKTVLQQEGRKPSWVSTKPTPEAMKKTTLSKKPIMGGSKQPSLVTTPKTKEPIVCLDVNTLGVK